MDQTMRLLERRESEGGALALSSRSARRPDIPSVILTVVGGFLVHISLSLPYAFGNLETYMVSHMKNHDTYSEKYSADVQWVLGLFFVAKVMGMLAAGWLHDSTGPGGCTLIGCLLNSAGLFLTSLSLTRNVWAVAVTLGMLSGAGTGLAYASPMAMVAKLWPERSGLTCGIITAGYGVGAVVYNEAATTYVNPDNTAAIRAEDGNRYFTDPDVLSRTPRMFLVLGCVSLAFQCLGCAALYSGCKIAKSMGLPKQKEVTVHIPLGPSWLNPNPTEIKSTSSMFDRTRDLDPGAMLRTRQFLLLWLAFCLTTIGTCIALAEYKNFGQTFIRDDHYLAHVATFSSLLGAVLRPAWGVLADISSFKTACIALCSVSCLTFGSWYLTSGLPEYVFLIWACVLALTISGSYLLFPLAVARSFGLTHYLSNVAVVFSALMVSGIVAPSITSLVMGTYRDWFTLFTIIAVANFFALLLVLFVKNGPVEAAQPNEPAHYSHVLD